MRVSTDEVTRGSGRWVARLHDLYGNILFAAFCNDKRDIGALEKLAALLLAQRSGLSLAIAALKLEHSKVVDVVLCHGDFHTPGSCETCKTIAQLEQINTSILYGDNL